jgi:hypothetical protein
MDTVYIETSIVSHASAWPSSNPATAVLQDHAKRWLSDEAPNYELVTSQFVIDEVSLGDPDAAARRLKLLEDVRLLVPDADVEAVADAIISHALMPPKARLDALHVASAAVGGVQYLLTQNCRHIANAHVLPQVYDLLTDMGFARLLICTPVEFLGDPEDGSK